MTSQTVAECLVAAQAAIDELRQAIADGRVPSLDSVETVAGSIASLSAEARDAFARGRAAGVNQSCVDTTYDLHEFHDLFVSEAVEVDQDDGENRGFSREAIEAGLLRVLNAHMQIVAGAACVAGENVCDRDGTL